MRPFGTLHRLAAFGVVAGGPTSAKHQVLGLLAANGQLILVESIYGIGPPTYPSHALQPYMLQRWTHVAIDLLLSTSPATASVHLDGQLVLDRVALHPSFAPGVMAFAIGIINTTIPTQAWVVRDDNVTLDWR